MRLKKTLSTVGLTALALGCATGLASADTVKQLEDRIAKLESRASAQKGTISTATGADLTFYGYARADAYKDMDYDLGSNNIGFGALTGASPKNGKFGAHAYQTRLGIRGSFEDVKFNVEGDFYGANGAFRLRQAYGEYAGFTIGQTWSNWNSDANPSAMVDFNGVPGGAGYRAVQLRYTVKPTDKVALSFSIEDESASYKARPILTAAMRYTEGTTNVKLALASRQIENLQGDDVSAWGGSIGVNAAPWEGAALSGFLFMGEGVSGLVNFSNGVGQQAGGGVVRGSYDLDINGKTIGIKGYGFSLNQVVAPKFELGLSYGRYDYDNFAGSVGSSTKNLDAGIVSAKYKPTGNTMFALEYMKLNKKFFNGDKISADRVLAVAQYSF